MIKNIFGAFADGAVLFPILVLLVSKSGFPFLPMVITTGIAYIVAGFWFRVPMSIQPLKSIAIAALSVGATFTEIRVSAFLLGLVFVLLLFFKVEKITRVIPSAVISAIQFGLGVMLVRQGLKAVGTDLYLISFLLVAFMLALPVLTTWPGLGIIATVGFIYSVVFATERVSAVLVANVEPRWTIILSLVLPQIVLTMGNSVLGTVDVSKKYFAEKANKVTIRNLILSIGFGNILSATVGGLPYCHGSGGVTAHVRGGANNWSANVIIGTGLLIMAVFFLFQSNLILNYPALLISALLITTGIYHLLLVKQTIQTRFGIWKISLAGLVAFITQNILWVFVFAMALEFLINHFTEEVSSDYI